VSRIVILGAGEIGGALARQVAAASAVSQVVLVDAAGEVAEGKALDIQQAAAIDVSATRVSGTSDIAAVVGASAIVFADRHEMSADEWQEDAGLALLRRVHGLNGRAPMLCAGAQQASLIERGVGELSVPHMRLFGSAPEALRAAVTSLVALEAACAPSDVSLAVLGRPPGHIVVPWESASLSGHGAADVLSPPALARLEARLSRLWPPGPLTLAAAAARVVLAALGGSPRTVAAFVALMQADDGSARAAMLPVTLGPSGIARVAVPQLTPRDRVRVDAALGA
jgi:malate dehydrogenase